MTKFQTKVPGITVPLVYTQMFPDVKWTGGSFIHASLAMGLPVTPVPKAVLEKIVFRSPASDIIWDVCKNSFPDVEWLVTETEFKQLAVVDLIRHIRGQCSTSSDKQLKNPTTQSVFHRMALRDGYVGGIRYWVEVAKDGSSALYFRFRWEKAQEAEDTVRRSSRVSVEEAQVQFAMLEKESMEIPEPYQEQAQKVRVTLH